MLLDALADVRHPVVFATAIVVLSAVPAFFMSGTSGALVQPLVMTYVLAVLAALLVALTLTPALGLLLLRSSQSVRHESAFSGWVKRVAEGLSPAVPRAGVALGVLAGIAGILVLPQLTITPAPDFKERDILVHWDATPGTSRAAMNRLVDRASRELKSIPGVRNVGAHIGRAIQSDQVVGIASSEMWVNLSPDADYEKTVSAIEDVVAGYPGIDGDVVTFLRSRFDEALTRVDEPIVVRVFGQDADVLRREATKLRQSLAAVPGIVDPHLEVENQEPAVEIEVDLAAARQYGVKPGDVRRAAAALLSGIEVGNLFEQQKIFEVVVWGTPQVRHSVDGIHDLLIDTPSGKQVRLGDLAKVAIVPTPNVIRRENVARTLDIVAGVKGRKVDAVSADVRARIREAAFPLEYRAELLGDFARRQAAWQRVAMAAVGAAIGIIFILQAAFGSWALAFAVAITLPIAAGGAILAAAGLGTNPSLAAMGGVLTVFGLAVRHSVLLVGGYRTLRTRDRMDFGAEVVRKGTREQAAPILLTAIVTAAAVLPFALFRSQAGMEALGPLAVVILGGLVTATLYALCVVPALYARFGEKAMSDIVETEDLGVAV